MSYTVIVAEINLSKLIPYVINYRNFVYALDFNNLWPFIADELKTELPEMPNIVSVGSFKADNLFLTAVNESMVYTTNNTYYYNTDNKILIFRLRNGVNPYKIGLTTLYIGDVIFAYWSNKPVKSIATVLEKNTLNYITQVAQEKDLALSGNQAYKSITVNLLNNNCYYDFFIKSVIAGNLLRLYYYNDNKMPESFDEFSDYGVGYISNIKLGNKAQVTVQDNRKNLTQILPNRKINKELYPYIDDNAAASYITQPWGKVSRCPLVCVNSKEPSASAYKYIVADIAQLNIDSVTTVYVNDNERNVTITPIIDTTNNIYYISIPSAAFLLDGNIQNIDKLSADILGYVDSDEVLIENALDILRYWLTLYCDFRYDSSYFDMTAWEVARSKALRIGFFIDKPTTIRDLLPQINSSIFGFFRWLPNNTVTYLITDLSQNSTLNIEKKYILNYYDIEIEENYEDTFAEAIIGWNKHWNNSDVFRYFGYPDTTDLPEELTPNYIRENYATSKVAEAMTTLLVYEDDVNIFYKNLMQQIGFTPRKTEIHLRYDALFSNIKIGQIINVELYRLDWARCEVIYVYPDLQSNKLVIRLRIIENIDNPIIDYVITAIQKVLVNKVKMQAVFTANTKIYKVLEGALNE